MPQHYLGSESSIERRPPYQGQGIGSPAWEREWERFINARRAMVESMMARSHAQAALPEGDPNAPPNPENPSPTDLAADMEPGALQRMAGALSQLAGPVGEWARRMQGVAETNREELRRVGSTLTGGRISPEQIQSLTRAAAVPEDIRRRDWIQLLGEAHFHQIPNAEKIPPDKLKVIIEARQRGMRNERLRSIMEDDPSLGGRAMEAIATAVGETGTTIAKTWMDMVQNIPFVGSELSKMKAVQDADIWLSSLQEGMRADLFEDELGGWRGAGTGAAGFVAYAVPATFIYNRIAALTGVARAAPGTAGMSALPQSVNLLAGRAASKGGRGMLAAKHATAGAGTMWLLEGGSDAPLSERIFMVGAGAGFGGAISRGGTVAGGTIGATVGGMGGLAAGAEPHEAALLAAAGGAVGVQTAISQQALAGMLGRLNRAFRSPLTNYLQERRWTHPPGAQSQPRGPGSRTGVEGQDYWVDPSTGGSPGTAIVPYRPPPRGPTPTPTRHPQLRTAEGNRIQALEHELSGARQQRDLQARLANTDALTGLGNRRALTDAARVTPPGEGWLVFDARRFKDVNDAHGHDAGDEALRGFAAAIRQAGEEMGLHIPAFRQGGDEFATRAPLEVLPELRQRIRELSRQEFEGGITTWLDGAEGATIGEADAALISLKGGSRTTAAEELPRPTGQVEYTQSSLFDVPPLQRTEGGGIPMPGQTPATALSGVRVGSVELLWRGPVGSPDQPGLTPADQAWRRETYAEQDWMTNWQPGTHGETEVVLVSTPEGNVITSLKLGGYRSNPFKGRPAGQDDELLKVSWTGMQDGSKGNVGDAIVADIHRLFSEMYPNYRYIGGFRVGGSRKGPAGLGAAYAEVRLQRGGQAKAEASTLTKHNTVLASPLAAEMSTQATYTDADVLRARAATHPGQVSLVRNVGDAAAAIREAVQAQVGRRLMPHQYRAVEMPDGSTDVLIADGQNLSNQMVQDYRTHGFFKGMRAVTISGTPVVVEGRPYTASDGTSHAMVRNANNPSEAWPDRLDHLLPGVSGGHMTLPGSGGLNNRLRHFASDYMNWESARAGIAAPGWLDAETTSQLPHLIERFLDARGITAPNQRAALTEYFHQRRLQDFRNATPPEDRAAVTAANAALRAAQREAGPDPRFAVEQAADAKHFTWLPDEDGGGVLADRLSDLRVPVESREAAREWLANFHRDSPDHTVISDVPAEVWSSPVGAAQGAGHAQWRDAEAYARGGEAGLRMSRARQEVEEGIIENELRQLDELLPPAAPPGAGGGGGPPPPPPPTPPGGGAELPGDAQRRLAGGVEPLGRQFRRLRRTDVNTLNEISNYNDGLLQRWWEPIMAWAPRFDTFMRSRGVDSNLAMDISAVGAGRNRANLEAQPFYNEASDILNRFRTRHLSDGTLFEIMQIAPHMGQERAMAAARFNKREREGVPMFRDLMERLHREAGYRRIGYIFDYMTHLMRLVNSNHPDPYGEWSKHLPEEHVWFARQMREGGVGAMEKDPRIIMQTYIRGLFYEKHQAGPVGVIREKWDHPDIPEGIKRPILALMAREQLGYNPAYDSAVQGVRRMLNTVGIPVTDREVMMLYGMGFTNLYRAYLSTPFHLMRESVTLGLTAARIGFIPMGKAIGRWASSPAAREEMNQRALEGGWGMADVARVPMAEMFQRQHGLVPEFFGGDPSALATSSTAFGPKQLFVRRAAGKVTGAIRDISPEGLRSGLGGTKVDPLYLYAALNVRERLLGGEAGWIRAHEAMEKYIAGEMPFRKLMYKSGASLWEENTQREFAQLVKDGKYKEAEYLLGREAADLQMRYGSLEQPFGMQEAGMVGKGFMGFGTFSNQLLWHFREAALGGRIPPDVLTPDDLLKLRPQDRTIRPDVANNTLGLLARYAAIMGAIRAAEITTGWDFGPWYWHRSFTFVGGPVVEGMLTTVQAARGTVRTVGGDYVPPEQRGAMNTLLGAPGALPYNFFPYRGPVETLRGIDQALISPDPVGQTFEQLVTGRQRPGDRIGTSIEEQMEQQRLSPTVPPTSLTSPGFGTINSPTPQVGTPGSHHVVDPSVRARENREAMWRRHLNTLERLQQQQARPSPPGAGAQ